MTALSRDLLGYVGSPPDPGWPGGARVAVSLVVNFEEGAEYSVADGDAENEAVYEIEQRVVGRLDPPSTATSSTAPAPAGGASWTFSNATSRRRHSAPPGELSSGCQCWLAMPSAAGTRSRRTAGDGKAMMGSTRRRNAAASRAPSPR